MNSQLRALLDRFGAMETPALLLRYRAGGLVPMAEEALLEVLSDRGYAGERLQNSVARLDVGPQPSPAWRMPSHAGHSHQALHGFNLALWLPVALVVAFAVLLAIRFWATGGG
ncbi:hypothetical protein [Dyella sp. A6]|uniref:hypothetical protein n=1 Tax=Dyella aluminiiresistens TaxID=3069105 RepID=UPI002E7711B9|nr:hypothetical protein [Dyella sp. A6]